jgi:hypothetical protein
VKCLLRTVPRVLSPPTSRLPSIFEAIAFSGSLEQSNPSDFDISLRFDWEVPDPDNDFGLCRSVDLDHFKLAALPEWEDWTVSIDFSTTNRAILVQFTRR